MPVLKFNQLKRPGSLFFLELVAYPYIDIMMNGNHGFQNGALHNGDSDISLGKGPPQNPVTNRDHHRIRQVSETSEAEDHVNAFVTDSAVIMPHKRQIGHRVFVNRSLYLEKNPILRIRYGLYAGRVQVTTV